MAIVLPPPLRSLQVNHYIRLQVCSRKEGLKGLLEIHMGECFTTACVSGNVLDENGKVIGEEVKYVERMKHPDPTKVLTALDDERRAAGMRPIAVDKEMYTVMTDHVTFDRMQCPYCAAVKTVSK